jgi:hypothetical protein
VLAEGTDTTPRTDATTSTDTAEDANIALSSNATMSIDATEGADTAPSSNTTPSTDAEDPRGRLSSPRAHTDNSGSGKQHSTGWCPCHGEW